MGEPDKSSLDIHGHTTPGDLGVGATSPGVALSGTPKSAPHITKSRSEPQCHSLAGGDTIHIGAGGTQ
jgi:hypothetical protein